MFCRLCLLCSGLANTAIHLNLRASRDLVDDAAAPKVGDPKVGTFEHIHAPIDTGDAVGVEAN
jgi:hypothetical protein